MNILARSLASFITDVLVVQSLINERLRHLKE